MQNNNEQNNINNDNPNKSQNKVNRIFMTREDQDFITTDGGLYTKSYVDNDPGEYRISFSEAKAKAFDAHLNILTIEFNRVNRIRCIKKVITSINTFLCLIFIILLIAKIYTFKIFICIELVDFILLAGVDILVKLVMDEMAKGGVNTRDEISKNIVDKIDGVESFTANEYKEHQEELLMLMGLSKSE